MSAAENEEGEFETESAVDDQHCRKAWFAKILKIVG